MDGMQVHTKQFSNTQEDERSWYLVIEVLEGDRILRQEVLRCPWQHSHPQHKPASIYIRHNTMSYCCHVTHTNTFLVKFSKGKHE